MCELIYYHAVIIFCICLVQNCLSQVKLSETVCESVLVLKLSVLKRTSKRLFIHPWKNALIKIHHLQSSATLHLTYGSVRVKKTKKFRPPPKLIFCHKLSPLDCIMVIWAIFGLPGPSEGSGGPMWGLGGPGETKFTNFHMGQFLALRCCFLDLTSF